MHQHQGAGVVYNPQLQAPSFKHGPGGGGAIYDTLPLSVPGGGVGGAGVGAGGIGRNKMRNEPNKWVPVVFVLALISFIMGVYVVLHLMPLLQMGKPASEVDTEEQARGLVRLAFFVPFTGLLLLNYW